MRENFSKRVQVIIKRSKEEAIRLGHSYVGSEHLLLGMLKENSGLSKKVLKSFEIDLNDMILMIEDMIKTSGGTMTLGHLPLTRRAERILRNAFIEASSTGDTVADCEHLLLAMLQETEGTSVDILKSFSIDYDTVKDFIESIVSTDAKQGIGSAIDNAGKSKTPTLDYFARDLTMIAQKGELDPVIGREKEIERVSQILTRRKKNNPVLIGEPGVGKTAIIEGLAQRIYRKTVPRILHDKRILSLDLPAIVAGTKYRGQFEERIKSLMSEIENNEGIIIFIDEVHNIVGAGGASGSLDASNMLKPSLARGDVHCIGATTMDEYRKFIEKDGALDRRFQKIIVNAPTAEESVKILNGLKEKYEIHHRVKYTSDAIISCVELSQRYISDKYLPDKAIDILDESGARANMYNLEVPKNIIDVELKIQDIRQEKEIKVSEQLFEQAAKLRDEEKKLLKKLMDYQKKWHEESSNNPAVINAESVADVVSFMTGIPLAKVAELESQRLLKLNCKLSKYIIGQDSAINSVVNAIKRSRTGLKNPNRPIGTFLFLGPTGVGKTELAKCLAKHLFPNNQSLIRIDMSEYRERFSISRLIGAPPGYIGYEEGGELTEKVRRNPYSVILLDEIEKGHLDVYNLLLQVFDEGMLTDSLGRRIDFRNSILIMTSNIGTRNLKQKGFGFNDKTPEKDYKMMKRGIMSHVQKLLSPELINRIDESIVFNQLNRTDVLEIIDIHVKELINNMSKIKILLKVHKSAKNILASEGYSSKYGVRHLQREIQKRFEDPLSDMLLKNDILDNTVITIKSKLGKVYFSYKVGKDKKETI